MLCSTLDIIWEKTLRTMCVMAVHNSCGSWPWRIENSAEEVFMNASSWGPPGPMPKNAQTTAQLYSSHTLVKWCSKFSKPGFNNMWTMNFQMVKLVLEKAEEPEIKLPTSKGLSKKQESSRKTSISALLTMSKPLSVWITIDCGKFLEMGIPDHVTCLLRNLYAGQEETVRTGHGTTDGSK